MSLLGLVLGLAADRVSADPDVDYARPGFYASLGGVYAVDLYEDDIEDALGPGVNVDIDPTGGLNARLGYRVLAGLAFELQYEWLHEYDIEIDVPAAGQGGKIELTQHTVTANARVFLPLGRFQPYLLVGAGFQQLEADTRLQIGPFTSRQKDDDTALAARAGVGFDLYVTPHVSFFGEGLVVLTDERIDVPGQDIDGIFYAGGSTGLTYRF